MEFEVDRVQITKILIVLVEKMKNADKYITVCYIIH